MFRLIYKSRSVTPVGWDLIHEILDPSEENNRRAGITGALVASKTHFLQVLEGAESDVLETFDRIKQDERHAQINVFSQRAALQRLFPSWAMLDIGVFAFSQKRSLELAFKYGDDEGGVYLPAREKDALGLIRFAIGSGSS